MCLNIPLYAKLGVRFLNYAMKIVENSRQIAQCFKNNNFYKSVLRHSLLKATGNFFSLLCFKAYLHNFT